MVSFLDKFKAGVAEAGNKAKVVVEINRLKLQNNSKQNEIKREYQAMGKLLFEAAVSGAEPLPKVQYEKHVSRILRLKEEINANLWTISELSNAKYIDAVEAATDVTPADLTLPIKALPDSAGTVALPANPAPQNTAPSPEIIIKKEQS
ncbi:hypothetical protein [Paenibacillus donghaensis]|uniref:Uncharacterized protein n=1 Tax=Paenibacillus donghaensis TaxID=414771 RepID=A0A2Z2K8T6_9BACL|nr:hypothetical protein [Paenibacillus donghaensis]ASA19735.1 hypothetical protein B9T62_02270 [Paenibacillus donghaensis]